MAYKTLTDHINPYLPPRPWENSPVPASDPSTNLPIAFRTSITTLLFTIPLGLVFGTLALVLLFYAISTAWPHCVLVWLMSILPAIYSFTTLASLKTQILVTKTDIQILDIRRKLIPLSNITKWNQNRTGGPVSITTQEGDVVYLMNWAMYKRNNIILGNVLSQLIGPPESNDG